MKQFTSSLDFSVTKKRLLMLSKKATKMRILPKVIVVIPVLAISTFMFFNKVNRQIVIDNGVKTAIEPVLLFQQADGSFSERMERHSYDGYRAYIRKGKPFTGVQRTLNLEDNLTVSEITFEDGWPTQGVLLNPITEHDFYRIEFDYEPSSKIIERNYDRAGTLIKSLHRVYNDDHPTRIVENFEYNGLNELVKTAQFYWENLQYRGRLELAADLDTLVHAYIDDNDVRIFKEYHPNGLLKFKMGSTDTGFEGYMTMYDENGTILEQELYENGELVEKIK